MKQEEIPGIIWLLHGWASFKNFSMSLTSREAFMELLHTKISFYLIYLKKVTYNFNMLH